MFIGGSASLSLVLLVVNVVLVTFVDVSAAAPVRGPAVNGRRQFTKEEAKVSSRRKRN